MEIHPYALDIIKTLNRHGHLAYFAGGWVRDYVLKRASDDIDIATSASPQEILDLFPRTLLIGLQFGVVIVLVDGHQYEVSTFRQDVEYINGRKPERIVPSGPKEDALRRDFTINGMFYDPLTDKIHDYVGGIEDLRRGVIRTIGDPQERFYEDRLRMVRAFRFAARFGFQIEPETQEAIRENAPTLFPAVAMERIWQEFTKMHAYPHFDRALIEMHRLDLLQVIFPELTSVHLKEIEKRVAPIHFYPKETPTAMFLLELFPDATADQIEQKAKGLKVPNKEIDFILYFKERAPFALKTRGDNARLYSHRYTPLCLEIYAARLKGEEKTQFLQKHQMERDLLQRHIERIREGKPLITSQLLLECGIPPGKVMGGLLKEAERLSVELDLHDQAQALQHLKQSPFWPSNAH